MASDPVLDAFAACRSTEAENPDSMLWKIVDGFVRVYGAHAVLTARDVEFFFWAAMEDGNTSALRALLADDRGEALDINDKLVTLADRGRLEAVQLLLADRRADPCEALCWLRRRLPGTVSAAWATIIQAARWRRRRNWICASAV
jgi:hypothetical protein